MKTKFIILTILIVALSLTGCNKNNPGTNEVFINNSAFVLSSTTVSIGTTVTWINKEKATHTVTSDNSLFSSGDLNKGQQFSYTFSAAGTFPYHCNYHYGMTGKIIVE